MRSMFRNIFTDYNHCDLEEVVVVGTPALETTIKSRAEVVDNEEQERNVLPTPNQNTRVKQMNSECSHEMYSNLQAHRAALHTAQMQKEETLLQLRDALEQIEKLTGEIKTLRELKETQIVSGNIGCSPKSVEYPQSEHSIVQHSYCWGDSIEFPSVPELNDPVDVDSSLEYSSERKPMESDTDSESPLIPLSKCEAQKTCKSILRPGKFNPDKEMWRDYAERFENIADWNGWTKQESALYALIQISGEPLEFLKRKSSKVRKDWVKLKTALEGYYAQPGISLKYQAKFDSAQCNQGETWSELAQRLRTLAEKAYGKDEGDSQPIFESFLLAKFLKLLPERIYNIVALKDFNVVEEAALAAMKIEAVSRKTVEKPTEISKEDINALESIVRIAQESVGNVNPQTSRNYYGQGRGRRKKKRNFEHGSIPGHGRGRGGPSNRSIPKITNAQIKCSRCEGLGHTVSACPSIVIETKSDKTNTSSKKDLVREDTQTGPLPSQSLN